MDFAKYFYEDYFDTDGNWVGDGGGASGFLLIANDTKKICIALRSKQVHSKVNGQNVQMQCWGTIGGATQGDPISSAKKEVAEETGFNGPYMSIFPAYVFSQGNFKYYNYIGLIPSEFAYHGHSWETDGIAWVDYNHLGNATSYQGYPFHDGLKSLLQDGQTRQIIQRIVEMRNEL